MSVCEEVYDQRKYLAFSATLLDHMNLLVGVRSNTCLMTTHWPSAEMEKHSKNRGKRSYMSAVRCPACQVYGQLER